MSEASPLVAMRGIQMKRKRPWAFLWDDLLNVDWWQYPQRQVGQENMLDLVGVTATGPIICENIKQMRKKKKKKKGGVARLELFFKREKKPLTIWPANSILPNITSSKVAWRRDSDPTFLLPIPQPSLWGGKIGGNLISSRFTAT